MIEIAGLSDREFAERPFGLTLDWVFEFSGIRIPIPCWRGYVAFDAWREGHYAQRFQDVNEAGPVL